MDINKTSDNGNLKLALVGRLDTTTAPELESVVKGELDGISALEIDMTDLEYISSAGLRVLLAAQKIMNKQGSMKVTHANDDIMEIFEVTGFSDILSIE